METTGAADLWRRGLIGTFSTGSPVIALTLILIVTMTLSDFMNNAATAAVMCPVAISTRPAWREPDSFLMAVAIGASCAFLTPIGHQNNTLILGPGGFRFGDYWRLGPAVGDSCHCAGRAFAAGFLAVVRGGLQLGIFQVVAA
jgi:di/tricarboxylate transporter